MRVDASREGTPTATIPLGSRVRLRDAIFPDGCEVAGLWQVIGRHGTDLIAENQGTVIRFPEGVARLDREPPTGPVPVAMAPTTVPAKMRRRSQAA